MENSNNKSRQSRFLLAIVLSLAVLAGWTYFFAPTKPPPADQANANSNAIRRAVVQQQQATDASAAPQPSQLTVETAPDTSPNRTITIKSPLYEVKLDSRGARRRAG